LLLALIGGLGLAAAVVWGGPTRSTTVAELLGLEPAGAELDARRANAVAALIADCMARLGLSWRPVAEPGPDIPDPALDPVAWADRWGFGVSTTADRPLPPGVADPNLSTLASLPPTAQRDYRLALHGSPGHHGCHEVATERVYGLRDRLLQPIRADLDGLDADIDADPGTAKALATWRGCVAEVSSGLTIDRRTLPGALMERFANGTAAISGGRVALRALQTEERRVAGVIARCEVAYGAVRRQVAARNEVRFLATHQEALVRIGAAIRAAEAALPTLPPIPP
jgi:hypothetical protein